MLRYDKQLALV